MIINESAAGRDRVNIDINMQRSLSREAFEHRRQIIRLGQTISHEQNRNTRRDCLSGQKDQKEDSETDFGTVGHAPNSRRTCAPFSTFYFLILTFLSHPGVAMPLDLRHLTGRNIDIERPVASDSFLVILLCYGVMAGRE